MFVLGKFINEIAAFVCGVRWLLLVFVAYVDSVLWFALHEVECLVACSDYLALNVYVALCYYKLDYYDVSQVCRLCA